jgi:cytochrome oxidase Cu insertion factor (SCO1/SenC/PrrC family)
VAILAFVLLLFLVAGSWLRHLAIRPPEKLPDLGAFPRFSARDAAGRPWTNANLTGKIWVADALPPQCASCAVRNLRMTDLQTSLSRARGVALVTFVEDPSLASPEKLIDLAREFGAADGRWIFLAGSVPIDDKEFLLVDDSGRVRARVPESRPAISSEVLDGVGDLIRERRR